MDPYPYIVFVHVLLMWLLSMISIYFSGKSLKVLQITTLELSPSVKIYIIYSFLLSISIAINYSYMTLWWQPDTIGYNTQIVFVTGCISAGGLLLNALVEIFLCLDRCLSIIFPMVYLYNSKLKLFLGITNIFSILATTAFIIWFTDIISLWPKNITVSCIDYTCVRYTLPAGILPVKNTLSILNICFGIILFLLLRFRKAYSSSKAIKRINKTVLLILLSTTICDFAPSFLLQVFRMIFQRAFWTTPYIMTLLAFNNTMCIGIYYYGFKKILKTHNSVIIHPT